MTKISVSTMKNNVTENSSRNGRILRKYTYLIFTPYEETIELSHTSSHYKITWVKNLITPVNLMTTLFLMLYALFHITNSLNKSK
jgi:hypothetical protein